MRTPMQELIHEMQKSPLMFASALTLIEQMRMLEKEKEAIINAYNHAYEEGWDYNSWQPEQYYNITFNTKEK